MFKRFVFDKAGATAIEYALIASLIAVVIVAALTITGSRVNSKFTAVNTGLSR